MVSASSPAERRPRRSRRTHSSARFLQHVLPDGFVKIRHFGLLAAGNVNTKLVVARRLLLEARRSAPPKVVLPLLALFVALYRPPPGDLGWRDRMILLTGIDPLRCRRCGASLVRTALPSTRDQPAHLDSS
jgi:hypothetical protein